MAESTFSTKLHRLEEIIAELEKPELELEVGLKLLEEGVKLHQDCQEMLKQTQVKITKLLDVNQTQGSDTESIAMTEPASSAQSEMESAKMESEMTVTDLFTASQESTNDEEGLPF